MPSPCAGRTSALTPALLDVPDECPPLIWGEEEGRSARSFAVTHGDDTRKVRRHFDALPAISAGVRRLPPLSSTQVHC